MVFFYFWRKYIKICIFPNHTFIFNNIHLWVGEQFNLLKTANVSDKAEQDCEIIGPRYLSCILGENPTN